MKKNYHRHRLSILIGLSVGNKDLPRFLKRLKRDKKRAFLWTVHLDGERAKDEVYRPRKKWSRSDSRLAFTHGVSSSVSRRFRGRLRSQIRPSRLPMSSVKIEISRAKVRGCRRIDSRSAERVAARLCPAAVHSFTYISEREREGNRRIRGGNAGARARPISHSRTRRSPWILPPSRCFRVQSSPRHSAGRYLFLEADTRSVVLARTHTQAYIPPRVRHSSSYIDTYMLLSRFSHSPLRNGVAYSRADTCA